MNSSLVFLLLEIMLMAKRRNDEDEDAIRRHFGFKLEGTFVVFARGGRLYLIDRGDGASDDERTVYDGDAPTDDVSPANGAAEASSASLREDRRLPSWDGGESDHGRGRNQKLAQDPPRGGDRVREARARRHSVWGALPGVVGYGAVGADPHQSVHECPGVPRGIVRGFVLAL